MIENDKTLWCGNLPEQVTEELLYELFLQAGPLERVHIPRDRDGRQKNFAFITYCHEVSVPYALNLLRSTVLFHKTLSLQNRGRLAMLPPPIRYAGPNLPFDCSNPNYITQQFVEMTEGMKDDPQRSINMENQKHDYGDKLVQDSLQGNWSHRHHPYRPKETSQYNNKDQNKNYDYHRNDYRGNDRSRPPNWRDRRSHRKGGYHQRD